MESATACWRARRPRSDHSLIISDKVIDIGNRKRGKLARFDPDPDLPEKFETERGQAPRIRKRHMYNWRERTLAMLARLLTSILLPAWTS